jgi:hypothetical protein
MEIIWEHSLWLLGPAMGIAGILSLWLYYKDQRLQGSTPVILLLLRFLRFSALLFLLALLLEPFVRQLTVYKEKPIMAILWDESRSMTLSEDSSEVRALRSEWQDRFRSLESDFELDFLGFGSETRPMASDQLPDRYTSFQELYSELEERYRNRPLRGIVLASDGIATRSYLPGFENLGVPIYTLAVGDTSLRRDAGFGKTRYNSTAFLGNTFPIEATVLAYAMAGEEVVVELQEDGVKIDERRFMCRDFRTSETLRFTVEAKNEGTVSYDLIIKDISSETNTENNRRQIFVRVVDRQEKVLLLGAKPHPDLGAVAQALNKSEQFVVETYTEVDDPVSIDEHSLIIVHSYGNLLSTAWRDLIEDSDLPVWFISGPHDDQLMLNTAQRVLQVEVEDSSGDEVRATLSNDFVLYETDQKWNELLRKLPPLQVPFGAYGNTIGANTLLYQRVGNVETKRPLLSFGVEAGRKQAVLIGTGIWRWRLAEYGINGNQDIVDGLILKTAIYLSSRINDTPLRLFHEPIYDEGDPIRIRAELYNESNERITEPEVELLIREEEGAEYPMLMSRRGDIYELRQSQLPAGSYQLSARTVLGGEELRAYSSFDIRKVLEELRNLRADHAILREWSERSGGQFYVLSEADAVLSGVKNGTNNSSSLFEQTSIDPLVNIPWLLLIPGFLLGLEWIIRKWAGTY